MADSHGRPGSLALVDARILGSPADGRPTTATYFATRECVSSVLQNLCSRSLVAAQAPARRSQSQSAA